MTNERADSEHDGIRPAGDEPGFDPDTQDSVRQALRGWGFSLDTQPYEPVPVDVWNRVRAAIDTAATAEAHVFDGSSGASTRRLRALPGGKWTTPLIAASVAVLAVAIGASVLGPFGGDSQEGTLVASDSPTVQAEALDVATTRQASPQVVQAGFVPPAKKVMELPDEVTSATLANTVDQILEDVGIYEPADVLEMPTEDWTPADDGMTSGPEVLRDCVTKITKVETSQALLVLRANVNGLDAGLVVVPEFMVDMTEMDGMDAEKMRRMGRKMGVTTIYVVEPTCGMRGPEHDPTLLRVSFTLAP